MFRARGTLDLDARLMKRPLISLKVSVNFVITHFTIPYMCMDVRFSLHPFFILSYMVDRVARCFICASGFLRGP